MDEYNFSPSLLSEKEFSLLSWVSYSNYEHLFLIKEDFPEMKVIGSDSKLYGGANAILYVCKKIWWASPLWALAHIPFARTIFDYIYKLIAKRRHCHGMCEV